MPPAAPPFSLPIPQATLSTADSSMWDRVSTWVSENKAIVYTVAGVAVVITGAGAVYYLRNGSDTQVYYTLPATSTHRASVPCGSHAKYLSSP